MEQFGNVILASRYLEIAATFSLYLNYRYAFYDHPMYVDMKEISTERMKHFPELNARIPAILIAG